MKLFYGVAGGLSTHNREFETSSYKVPAIAVFLRQNADHIPPFVIQNRMIGESAGPDMGQGMHEGVSHGYTFPISPEPAIVNYCYKTPEYAMGGAVQDPKGNDSGITRQDRWSGILFNDATRTKIVPIAETQNSQSNSTRVHNAYWNVQHKNLMISKKMRDAKYMGRLMVYITPSLERVERDGWVFSSNGSAYAAVMAIGGQNWDAAKQNWTDTQFLVSKAPNAPFVFLAGGKSDGFESFDQFQDYVLKRVSLTETDDGLVIARPGEPEVVYFYNGQPALIGGKPIDLKPSMTYDSPYLRSKWGSGIVEAHWGPLKSVYDFNQETVQDNFEIPKEPESQPDDLPGAKHASQAAKKE
jgi:hypothetical protein